MLELLDISMNKVPLSDADFAYLAGLYDENLAYADYHFKLLRQTLQRLDLWEKSIIMILSDHGEAFGEHGKLGHGSTIFDETIRVPLIIRFPSFMGVQGTRVSSMVELVDLFPTILKIFEIPDNRKTSIMHGRDFTPLIFSDDAIAKEITYSISMPYYGMTSLRSDKLKLIYNHLDETTQFFDLGADPKEKTNIAESRKRSMKEYRKLLLTTQKQNRKAASLIGEREASSLDERTKKRLKALGYLR